MKTALQKMLVIFVLVLGSESVWAADMCFLDDFNSTLIGKNFAFPGPGKCKEFNGYELGTNCILTGAACGTSDSAQIRFHWNYSCPFGAFGTSSFAISRLYSDINQAGFGYACQPNTNSGNWTCTQWHIKQIPCPASRPLN